MLVYQSVPFSKTIIFVASIPSQFHRVYVSMGWFFGWRHGKLQYLPYGYKVGPYQL